MIVIDGKDIGVTEKQWTTPLLDFMSVLNDLEFTDMKAQTKIALMKLSLDFEQTLFNLKDSEDADRSPQ